MTIGYIAQEISPKHLCVTEIDQCFSVLIENLNFPELEVQRITASALNNFIIYGEKSMGVEAERNFIVNGIIQSLKSGDLQMRVLAMQAIVELSRLYYDQLGPHIGELIEASKYHVYIINIDDQR